MKVCLKVGTTVLLLGTTISGCSWFPFHDGKPIELNDEIYRVADQIQKAHCRLKKDDGGLQKEVQVELYTENTSNIGGEDKRSPGLTFSIGHTPKESRKVTMTLDPSK